MFITPASWEPHGEIAVSWAIPDRALRVLTKSLYEPVHWALQESRHLYQASCQGSRIRARISDNRQSWSLFSILYSISRKTLPLIYRKKHITYPSEDPPLLINLLHPLPVEPGILPDNKYYNINLDILTSSKHCEAAAHLTEVKHFWSYWHCAWVRRSCRAGCGSWGWRWSASGGRTLPSPGAETWDRG